ncbi:hypothetical protein OKW33_006184 [Paraburkholderia atlantica]|uniref:Uncharacterized protein n=1 Tax=Paraburkholderia atlantica TaxID=2654982 RepID=A0A7W8QG72_PARAM|nr:hypothetical protein [Paraburkholderia atlantica]
MFRHTRDAPFLTSSFQQIAERYRNLPDGQMLLEHKLRLGGKAHSVICRCRPVELGGPLSAETRIPW